ncbi:hypothetical protein ONE63_001837 [Megalurothrips usitatus]|nr:hypothetical protein ONE63_001837 [Megalurothrips usitatus]
MGSLGYFNIFVTHAEKHGNFLRVYGHLDHTSAKTVERLLQQQFEHWEGGNCLPESVHVDALCAARYSDGAYYRARVLAVEPGFATVVFIDFGNRERLPLTDLRVPGAKEAASIFRIPAQASPFILSGVIGPWTAPILNEVMAKIGYEEVTGLVIKTVGDSISLLKVYHENRDYCDTLQSQGFASVVPQEYFEALVLTTLTGPAPMAAPMTVPGYPIHPMQQVYPNQNLLMEQVGVWPMWQRVGAAGAAPALPALTLSVPISMAPTLTTVPASGMAGAPPTVTPSPLRSVPSHEARKKATPLTRFNALTLDSNSEHKVFVSHVEKGTFSFAVQLSANEKLLETLVDQLNSSSAQFSHLGLPFLPGTTCLAKYSEDDTIYRAVVTSAELDRCRVYFVDYGNTDAVKCQDLFEIPAEYTQLQAMAVQFTLAGVGNVPTTEETCQLFYDLVLEKDAVIQVVPSKTGAKQLCELFIEDTNIKELINLEALKNRRKKAPRLEFKNVQLPETGSKVKVVVAYVKSFSQFYVQLAANSASLKDMMSRVNEHCNGSAEPLQESDVQPGAPCCALFDGDGQYYRAILLNCDMQDLSVMYVDFGNVEKVTLAHLKSANSALVDDLRTQAIPCALQGFENLSDEQLVSKFEELVLEKTFTMHVEKLDVGQPQLIVRLFDSDGADVSHVLAPQPLSTPSTRGAQAHNGLDSHADPRGSRSSGRDFARDSSERGERSTQRDRGGKSRESLELSAGSQHQSKADPEAWGIGKGGRRLGHCDRTEVEGPGYDARVSYHNQDKPSKSSSCPRQPDKTSEVIVTSIVEIPHMQGSQVPVVISWFESPARFYCQLKSTQAEFEKRMRDLQSDYECRTPLSSPRVGDAIVARFKEDNGFYRGVIKIQKGNKFGVQYIDYGNKALLESNHIYGLLHQYSDFPAHAIPCQLKDVKPPGEKWVKSSSLAEYFSSGEFTLSFHDAESECCTVSLKRNGIDVGTDLISKKLASPIKPTVSIAVGSSLPADLSFIKSADEFYVHLQSGSEELEEMQGQLQAASSGMEPLSELPQPGTKIMALYSEDSVWYRGQMQPDGRILFIDYGNDEHVELENMKKLPEGLASVDAMALKCSLAAPDNMGWLPCVMERLESELESGPFTVVVRAIHEDLFTVDVINSAGCSIGTSFAEEGLTCGQENQGLSLAVGDSSPADLSFIKSANEFYVHLQSESEKLEQLQGLLQAASTSMELLSELPQPGTKIMALYSEDSVWYRGQTLPDGRILFIDYGNDEHVELENMKKLPQELSNVRSMALKCSLAAPDDRTWAPDVMDQLVSELESGPFTIIVKAINDDLFVVDVLNAAGSSVSTTLAERGLLYVQEEVAESVVSTTQAEQGSVCGQEEVENLNLAVGSCLPADLSFIKSPNEFYIHPLCQSNKLEKMQEDLQAVSHCMRLLSSLPETGDKIMALYSQDSVWYRGQVLPGGRILFIDYGNDEDVELENMRNLPPEFSTVDPLALKCSLASPSGMTWSPSVMDKLVPELESGPFTVVIKENRDNLFIVDVVNSAGCSVGTALAGEGLLSVEEEVKGVSLLAGSNFPADLSFIKSANEFYVHLQSESEKLEQIQGQLQAASTSMESLSELPQPGTKIMALYSEDSVWYRGQTLPDGRILFIDYGNDEHVELDNMKKLPEGLASVGAMALTCSLAAPENKAWSPRVMDRLVSELESGPFTVVVKAVEDELLSVDVINAAGHSIGSALVEEGFLEDSDGVGECVALRSPGEKSEALDASVVFAESPAEFYIHLSTDESDIENVAASLSSAEHFPEIPAEEVKPGLKCAALFDADMVWYRAKVLKTEGGILVKFIDYGNEAITTSIRALPHNLEQVHPLALHCTLPAPDGGAWMDCAIERFNQLIDAEDKFQVELLSSVEPFITNLIYNGGEGVYQELASMCGKEKLEVDQELVHLRESLKSPSASRDTFRSPSPPLARGKTREPAVESNFPAPAVDEIISSSGDVSRAPCVGVGLVSPLGISAPEEGEITVVSEADSCTPRGVTEASGSETNVEVQELVEVNGDMHTPHDLDDIAVTVKDVSDVPSSSA